MKKISIILLTLLVAMSACKKTPEVNLKYVDVERDLITVGTTTATMQCDYKYIATLKKAYFYYGEGEDTADMNAAEMRVVQNTLYVDLTGLKENTTYNYYYEFYNGFNSMRTALNTFKTEAGNGGGEEPPTPPEIMLPTVITAMVTEITTNSAQCGGEVVDDGGAEVTERGICWGTSENPTLNDNLIAVGMGIGAFTAMMNGLEANTTYHVRAYATNEMGTAYGLDKEFSTLSGGSSGAPEGAINGLFTINENGDQVYFSKGNLQYQASTNTWRFAEHQWDFVGGTDYSGSHFGNVSGSSNNEISPTYEGWIDLFCWGTSGWDNGNVYYHPYDYERLNEYAGYGYGPTDGTNLLFNLAGTYANADWGIYNPISNGGNQPNQWRTLTFMEWVHLFELRNSSSGIRFAKAVVGGVNGIILLPDDWDASFYPLNNANRRDAGFGSNVMTISTWLSVFQTNGAVFLSETGQREVLGYYYSGGGSYWSTTFYSSRDAKALGIGDGGMTTNNEGGCTRDLGLGVRLVRDKNYSPTPAPELANVFTIEPYSTGSVVVVFQGRVEFEGSSPIIERGFYWGTSENPGPTDNCLLADEVYPDLFFANFIGWVPNTTYHVRAYAKNGVGTAYGLDVEFTLY
jgi:hypothetical protein